MTTLESILKENGISFYRAVQLLEKKMGNFNGVKAQIKGEKSMPMNDFIKLINGIANQTKKPINIKSIPHSVISSVVLE